MAEGSESTDVVEKPRRSFEAPRLWISIDPRDEAVSRWGACEWVGFLNRAVGGWRGQIGQYEWLTSLSGWDGLAEIDDALWCIGLLRTTPWEIGSGRGFVAYVATMRVEGDE
ncbi:hypothetical protein ACF044_05860 [Microbacterium sp. NPDC016588]